MVAMEEVTAGLGHNSGTPAEMVQAELGEALLQFTKRRDDLVGSAGRVVITDNDQLGRASDLHSMIVVLLDRIDAARADAVEPHRQAQAAGMAVAEKFAADLFDAKRAVREAIDKFRADQREAAEKAQAEQAAAEAVLRAAKKLAEKAPEPTQPIALPAVKGDYGSRTGDRKVKTYSWKDVRKVDLQVFKHPKVVEAMQAACRQLDQAGVTLKGVTIDNGYATTVRK
jgi:hypothetical protein